MIEDSMIEDCNCGLTNNWELVDTNIKVVHDKEDKWHYLLITVGDKESSDYAIKKLLYDQEKAKKLDKLQSYCNDEVDIIKLCNNFQEYMDNKEIISAEDLGRLYGERDRYKKIVKRLEKRIDELYEYVNSECEDAVAYAGIEKEPKTLLEELAKIKGEKLPFTSGKVSEG